MILASAKRSGPGRVDPGRYGGIRRVQASRYNLLGPFNDDATASTATGTRFVAREHRNFGEFRVPSLRNVARTAPYMHNGVYQTLDEVVEHYDRGGDVKTNLSPNIQPLD